MIVVGAGIIGLSCAWMLSRAGHRVTVFDRREAAREASWAGAGMLAPGGEFEADSPLARMSIHSLASYPVFVQELREESGLPIDFRACGGIEVALSEAEAASLRSTADRRTQLGIVSEETTYSGFSARFYPGDAVVDPRQIANALLAICGARGVTIRENEPVIRVSDHQVQTSIDTYEAESILIAAGAWSSALYPDLPQTKPVRGHLMAWQMAPNFLEPILRHNGTYLLQRSSGLLIGGSSTEDAGFDRSLDESILADIERRATSLLPELAGHAPTERWNGLRPGIEAEGPLIGRIPGTDVYTAFGHYRNGILLAPETAHMIAELIR